MATGPRRASVMGCSALKSRMRLAEDTKAVMRLAEERPASSMQRAQELVRDLQRAAAVQGERLRRAEQELASTRGRLGAVTRKLAEKEAAAERARSQAEESKDAEIERLRADLQALRQGQEEAAQVRAQLVTASMEASATAQRARELEQRIKGLENATVSTSVSPERRSRAPPSAPAGSPESAGSSRESSSEGCSTLGSVSWAPTSVGAPDTQATIRDLQRAVAAQAERLRSAELEISRTRDCVAAVTRKLGEREAEAERAERARGQLAGELELSRQELREREAVNERLLSRLSEKERAESARSQLAESAQRLQQELAAASSALREKDAVMEVLRADQQKLLREAQDEAAHARAQLVAACREACATAQRARELEQRISELEKPTVATGGSTERRPGLLPSGPAGSPESAGSSREGSTEAGSTLGSVSSALSSVRASDTRAERLTRCVVIWSTAAFTMCILYLGTALLRVQQPASQVVPRAQNQKNSIARSLMKKARSPARVTASFAFNIDTIGFRLAEFVPAAWAPVRRKAATDVLDVHSARIACWRMAATFSFRMQAGDNLVAAGRVDEVGPTVAAKRDFEELRASVLETDSSGTTRHVLHFLRRISMVLIIFEQYHVEMQDLNQEAAATFNRLVATYNKTLSTLQRGRPGQPCF